MRRAWLAGFFCVFILGVASSQGATQGLVLTGLDGRSVPVDSLLADGPLVVNFWATWCKPCKLEMPHLEKVYEELGPKGVHFAAISLDSKRSEKRLAQYVETNGVTLPVYWDPDGKLARLFKVAAIPTTVVLDQDGNVQFRTRGYRPGDEVLLKKKVEGLVRDREEGVPDTTEEG
jgi:thiol-disulfide isomerase/thioredoxin